MEFVPTLLCFKLCGAPPQKKIGTLHLVQRTRKIGATLARSPVIGRKIEDVLQIFMLGLIFSNFKVYFS
jgi:hypothetical protein